MRRLFLGLVVVAWWVGFCGAQAWPPQDNGSWTNSGTIAGFSSRAEALFSRLSLNDLRVGLALGGGSLDIRHDVSQGAAGILGYADFGFVNHNLKTNLRDAYVTFGGSMNYGDQVALTLDVETSLGLRSRFSQTTEPVTGYVPPGGPIGYGRWVLGVLWLDDGAGGSIDLGSSNQLCRGELMGHIPAWTGLDFLVGYKWTRTKTAIDSASQDFGLLEFGYFRGSAVQGWGNVWTDDVVGPSTTSFTMGQLLLWHGPYIGFALKDTLRTPWIKYYLAVTASPCLFAQYNFDWTASYTQPNGAYITGSQLTRATGWRRFGVDFQGGYDMNVTQTLVLGFNALYSYAYMNGSDPESQQLSNNQYLYDPGHYAYFLAGNYGQSADGSVGLIQRFWSVGGSLALAF